MYIIAEPDVASTEECQEKFRRWRKEVAFTIAKDSTRLLQG